VGQRHQARGGVQGDGGDEVRVHTVGALRLVELCQLALAQGHWSQLLDGLAIGCTITVAFAYALLCYAAGNFRIAEAALNPDNSRMAAGENIFKQRVVARLAALKINAYEATRRAIPPFEKTFVEDILAGRKKSVSSKNLRRLADALDCDSSYLLGDQAQPRAAKKASARPLAGRQPLSIPVVADAETGAFRQLPELDDMGMAALPQIIAPRSASHPRATHFAFRIRGNSMNNAMPPLVEGMYALCVDLASADLLVETGKIYAVRRTLDGGHTYEVTIKRARVHRTQTELLPESTDPSHRPIIVPRDTDLLIGNEIKAIGWVYGAFSSFED
jgi:SOS-response transcriptional repressor LexA